MDTATLVAVITAVLGSGVLTAFANGIWQRRRNRADTAQILNDAALDLVVPLREQIKELRGEVAVYRQRVGMLERREREMVAALSAHAAWDILAQAAVIANKLEVSPMPPLFPPSSQRVEERTRAEDYLLPDTDQDDEEPRRPRRRRSDGNGGTSKSTETDS